MSGDELSQHLGRQVSVHNEKYKEPEPEVDEVIILIRRVQSTCTVNPVKMDTPVRWTRL